MTNICAKCGEPVAPDKPGCTALDQSFHLDCFICEVCSDKLAGTSFYSVEGKPYCQKDYLATLDKCCICNEPVTERVLKASGKVYHPACFICSACKKCLDGAPFTTDSESQIHCVECFQEKFAPKCTRCSKPIIPEEGKEESVRVVAIGHDYHLGCYTCEDCNLKLDSKIEGHGCYPLDSHLLCKDCNAKRQKAAAQ